MLRPIRPSTRRSPRPCERLASTSAARPMSVLRKQVLDDSILPHLQCWYHWALLGSPAARDLGSGLSIFRSQGCGRLPHPKSTGTFPGRSLSSLSAPRSRHPASSQQPVQLVYHPVMSGESADPQRAGEGEWPIRGLGPRAWNNFARCSVCAFASEWAPPAGSDLYSSSIDFTTRSAPSFIVGALQGTSTVLEAHTSGSPHVKVLYLPIA
jgi:hypothetical protein